MNCVADELILYLEGEPAYRFDKREATARMQFAYVTRMDDDMSRGIELGGERIIDPDQTQRNHFVIGQLLEAVGINDSRAIAMCARYLIHRAPQLDGLRIEEDGDEYRVDLIYG